MRTLPFFLFQHETSSLNGSFKIREEFEFKVKHVGLGPDAGGGLSRLVLQIYEYIAQVFLDKDFGTQ